jgi:hypothetical protein
MERSFTVGKDTMTIANVSNPSTPLLGAGHAPQSDIPGAILRLVRETTAAAAEQAGGRPRALVPLRPTA